METLEFEYYHVTTDDPFILSPRRVCSHCSSGAGKRQACLEDFVKSPSKCEGGLREGIE